jgi:hypothetical protein
MTTQKKKALRRIIRLLIYNGELTESETNEIEC